MHHEHKFFIYQVKSAFVPTAIQVPVEVSGGAERKQLYEMVEFAFLGCNCGEVIKTKVKDNTNAKPKV